MTLPRPEVVEPDWQRMVWTLHGCKNTLAGWFRNMEGYDDESMAVALQASWKRNNRDPRWDSLETYEKAAARLRKELTGYEE